MEISTTVIYEFWYDYVKPKYGGKAKLCYIDTDSFIVYIKTEDLYIDIAKGIEGRFDNSNYKLERLLPIEKIKKCYWINERQTKWKNNGRNCRIETRNI